MTYHILAYMVTDSQVTHHPPHKVVEAELLGTDKEIGRAHV